MDACIRGGNPGSRLVACTGDAGSDAWMPWRNLASTDDARFPAFEEKEALAGTEGTPSNTNRYVTDEDPRLAGTGWTAVDASETVKGIAELATQAETNTGTDDERIVTPLKLKTNVDLHVNDATDAHDASAISLLDSAAQYSATNVEDGLAEVLDALQAHEIAADPHTGYLKESDFTKAAIDALNVDADTLDGNDSAFFATATGLSNHISDALDAHDASAISLLDTAAQFNADTVEGGLAEVLDSLASP